MIGIFMYCSVYHNVSPQHQHQALNASYFSMKHILEAQIHFYSLHFYTMDFVDIHLYHNKVLLHYPSFKV